MVSITKNQLQMKHNQKRKHKCQDWIVQLEGNGSENKECVGVQMQRKRKENKKENNESN